MRLLKHVETLEYYDGIELFVAHDQLLCAYICLLIERNDNSDKYLCVPISKGRLNALISSDVDLRTIIELPETDDVYIGTVANDDFQHIKVQCIESHDILPNWLPSEGFFVQREPIPNIKVVEESHERNRAVIHCSLNPPESRTESKISADHLGQGVRLLQRVVRHAFSKCLQGLDSNTKDAINFPDNFELEVFAFSEGSFTLHMQTKALADLFGYAQVARAFELLDIVNYDLDDTQATVEAVASYGGHFATAYKDLLQFIVETKSPLSYEWSMPKRQETTKRTITTKQANPIYEALAKRENLGKEEKRLVGRVPKADSERGTWRLFSDQENREFVGKCDKNSNVDLKGIIIETQRYEFICDEQLVTDTWSKREHTDLFLKSYKPLP